MTNEQNNPNQAHITAIGDRSVAAGLGARDNIIITGDHVTVTHGGQETTLSSEVLARLTEAYLQAIMDRWTRLEADETRPPLDTVFFMLEAREREERRPLEAPFPDLPPTPNAARLPMPVRRSCPSRPRRLCRWVMS